MSSVETPAPARDPSVIVALIPILAAVVAGFLVTGFALPVLPLHVSDNLGFGSFMVGLVAGVQFAASILCRIWAGAFADRYGPGRTVKIGLLVAALAGALYLLSLACHAPGAAVIILILGRAVLGGAESFIITGGVAWGLALVDKANSGQVIAWVGTAMFAALAFGGPVGVFLFDAYGFASIAVATMLLPALAFLILPRISLGGLRSLSARAALPSVVEAVWLPGVGAALSSVGYSAIIAFGSLLFAARQWQPVWLAFSAFAVALILARMLCGHLPDKLGGAKVTLLFVMLQSAGLVLMGLAGNPIVAAAGAALAGFGYSLVYPGLGVEAVRDVAPENRGLAMGLFTVFLDIAMAIGSPTLGWVADAAGIGSVFLVSAVIVLMTLGVVARLLQSSRER